MSEQTKYQSFESWLPATEQQVNPPSKESSFAAPDGSALAVCKRVIVENGKIKTESYKVPVQVMAVAEGYAMVRRKRCVPFVIELKLLLTPNDQALRPAGNGQTTETKSP